MRKNAKSWLGEASLKKLLRPERCWGMGHPEMDEDLQMEQWAGSATERKGPTEHRASDGEWVEKMGKGGQTWGTQDFRATPGT